SPPWTGSTRRWTPGAAGRACAWTAAAGGAPPAARPARSAPTRAGCPPAGSREPRRPGGPTTGAPRRGPSRRPGAALAGRLGRPARRFIGEDTPGPPLPHVRNAGGAPRGKVVLVA